jgi:hypothetical protein
MVGRPFHRSAWTDLCETIRTGQAAFPRVHGTPMFDFLRGHPADSAVFDAAMTSFTEALGAAIVSGFDFGQFRTIVDVGGGHGSLLAMILSANPGVRGVLFDLPDVVAGAAANLDGRGVADRCELVGGSFFDAVPAAGDAYILSAVIHDHDDEPAVGILRNCRAAMAERAQLLLVEGVLPKGLQPDPILKLADLEMLVMAGGRQRTLAEFTGLLECAGLRLLDVTPSPGLPSLLRAEKGP